jgi:hypothetical protein
MAHFIWPEHGIREGRKTQINSNFYRPAAVGTTSPKAASVNLAEYLELISVMSPKLNGNFFVSNRV